MSTSIRWSSLTDETYHQTRSTERSSQSTAAPRPTWCVLRYATYQAMTSWCSTRWPACSTSNSPAYFRLNSCGVHPHLGVRIRALSPQQKQDAPYHDLSNTLWTKTNTPDGPATGTRGPSRQPRHHQREREHGGAVRLECDHDQRASDPPPHTRVSGVACAAAGYGCCVLALTSCRGHTVQPVCSLELATCQPESWRSCTITTHTTACFSVQTRH